MVEDARLGVRGGDIHHVAVHEGGHGGQEEVEELPDLGHDHVLPGEEGQAVAVEEQAVEGPAHEGWEGGRIFVAAAAFAPLEGAEGEGAVGLPDEGVGQGRRVQLAGDAGFDGFLPCAGAEGVARVGRLEHAEVVVEGTAGVPHDFRNEASRGHGGQVAETLDFSLADRGVGVGAGVLHLDGKVPAVVPAYPDGGVRGLDGEGFFGELLCKRIADVQRRELVGRLIGGRYAVFGGGRIGGSVEVD